MLKFNNTHIFTGYLKQLLSNVNLPTCRVYTSEFARYLDIYGKEDPRIISSFDFPILDSKNDAECIRMPVRNIYLKNNCFSYYLQDVNSTSADWKESSATFYDIEERLPGLTKSLFSPGIVYDAATHEFLGDYLRFLRDYYDVNLMSLYNCFNNRICNIDFSMKYTVKCGDRIVRESDNILFDSLCTNYKIYALPVKLFSNYTIAIDSSNGIEMFCGFYKTALDTSDLGKSLINKTYTNYKRTYFNQPFIFNKLSKENWLNDLQALLKNPTEITRWDIAQREQDLKLFLKIPKNCKSSIVILEGDYRNFNDCNLTFEERSNTNTVNNYRQNRSIINFNKKEVDLNDPNFTPISRIQLLALNTGESYPFSDRLVEYLSGSAITPTDEIPDNIMRAQKVMEDNGYFFKIPGRWEPQMQKIIYDYLTNSGPIVLQQDEEKPKLIDKREGTYSRLRPQLNKNLFYDTLGYIDRDAEKYYACWKINKETQKDKTGQIIATTNKVAIKNSIQNVDIYKGLYDE